MKIVIISDTHNRESELEGLSGDVLIHCGDMFALSDRRDHDLERMDTWFGAQDFDVILCTGGNHDLALEKRLKTTARPFRNAVFLMDESFAYNGVRFYGSPWTPELDGHAFYKSDEDLAQAWAAIPNGTDVLITHTPPFGILDVCSWGLQLGCKHLVRAVDRVKPTLHCFGHVHSSAGAREQNGITYINASSVNSQLELAHAPHKFIV